MKIVITFIAFLISISSFAQPQESITPEKMKQDIVLLKSVLYNLHPGLYKYNTREDIEMYFSDLAAIASKEMPLTDFYLKVSQLVNKVKCGHTFPNPLNLDDDTKKILISDRVIPLYFKIIDGKIIISHNISNENLITKGDEIVSINGINSKTILKTLLTVSRADGNHAEGKKLCNLSVSPDDSYGSTLFDIYSPLFFPSANKSILVVIKNRKGMKNKYSLPYVSTKERAEKYESIYGKVAEGENSWIYKKLDSSTAYLKFGTFAFWSSDFNWKNFIDSSFALINKQQFQNLVIDLRGNEGGSGEIRDYILSMLTDKPLQNERNSINCYRYLVIPDSLNQYLSTWDRSFRQPKNADNYILNEIGLYQNKIQVDDHPILPSKNNFKGNTYLLVDAVCSSATFGLAWTFQYNRLGKIIGEPTGGTKQGLNGSEMFFFTMPNSHIEIDIPLIYFYTKNVKDEGVIPDVIIKLKQKDVYDNIDPVLDYVLKSVNLK